MSPLKALDKQIKSEIGSQIFEKIDRQRDINMHEMLLLTLIAALGISICTRYLLRVCGTPVLTKGVEMGVKKSRLDGALINDA